MNKEKLYYQICFNRFFELAVAKALDDKRISIPVYLSVGQEHVPAVISQICKDYLIFPQHRCHSWYLSFGGDPFKLRDELLGLETGCNLGRGGSPSISDKDNNIYGHSGLLGDQVPIAVGAAYASQKPTIVVLGDASCEEDYVLGAIGFATSKNAPVLFVVEDNDMSILTPKEIRRSWNICDVAIGLGMSWAENITDHPKKIYEEISFLTKKLPALVNINVCRELWHCGSGNDGNPKWNRFELITEEFSKDRIDTKLIQEIAQTEIDIIWQR